MSKDPPRRRTIRIHLIKHPKEHFDQLRHDTTPSHPYLTNVIPTPTTHAIYNTKGALEIMHVIWRKTHPGSGKQKGAFFFLPLAKRVLHLHCHGVFFLALDQGT
jgi:hypothetical protein